MAISNQEAERILVPYIEKADHAFEHKDLDAAAGFYDQTAVLVHAGKGATYGRDAIRGELKNFSDNMAPGSTFKASNKKYGGANGYIVYSGIFEMDLPSGQTMKGDFEQLWKKGADGKYLIFYDRFTLG